MDSTIYREQERRAKEHLANWRIGQRHNLDQFEKVGFPVRVGSVAETRQLLDTMQEGRFLRYQEELGGLSPQDADMLTKACARLMDFQRAAYPHFAPRPALDSLMAMLTSYKKLAGLKPSFRSILEVGPGSGYLSLFLAFHPGLESYVLTESCESFYLLQHLLNSHLFGRDFHQTAAQDADPAFFVRPNDPLTQYIEAEPELETPPSLARHYPWWRLGQLARNERVDLVVSNANFLEFNVEALRDYLALFKQVLAPDGLLVCQCFGFESPEHDRNYLLEELRAARIAPLFINWGGHSKARGFWERCMAGDNRFVENGDERRFTVANGVFITERHPLFAQCYQAENYTIHTMQNADCLDVFFTKPEQGRIYSRQEICAG